jgi:hypothetical protein
MAHATTQMSTPVVETVTLTLNEDEAQVLQALLYSKVTGNGRVRRVLNGVQTALHDALGGDFRLVGPLRTEHASVENVRVEPYELPF